VNRAELLATISDRTELTQQDVKTVLDSLTTVLTEVVAAGDKIQLPGLFTIETVERDARTGRNPRTGETIQIAARRAVKVTPASALKNAAAGK
jgi:DNA-binding protein HU-beta